jgi:16S rRNA (guanine1207-N2)-methyltransferase
VSESSTAPLFHCALGDFALRRRPEAPGQPLQAWDAADEYLLAEFAERLPAPEACRERTLAINDQFGALAVALHATHPDSWGDSCTAHLALAENFVANRLPNTATPIPATRAPMPAVPYRAVLWRIPKSLALFREQAALLRGAVAADTLVLAGGMIKHLPEQAVDILGTLGRVDILHARKKARLFRVTPVATAAPSPLPVERPLRIAELDLELSAGANVFARDKFDIGARFFIEQFRRLPAAARVADLGCGNGVLGIALQRLRPDPHIDFFDESYQAVASAARNQAANRRPGAGRAYFHVDDGLSYYRGPAFDLVLCNPPFHQSHAVGDQIAWRMFAQARQHLRAGGELWIVGNRHLDYHIKLKRLFGQCRQIAANPKFVVLAATK